MPEVDFPGPGGGDNFLERILGDLLQLMGGAASGGGRIDLARTLAQGVATGGVPEPNVEPIDRIAFEELARLAELHVAELTGLPVTGTGRGPEVLAVGPGTWAWHTLEDWRFLLDAMSAPGTAETLAHPGDPSGADAPPGLGLVDLGSPAAPDSSQELLARWMATMGPMLAAMQLGSAIGHMARSALGQYELPVPRPADRLLVVPSNVSRFAADWSLPEDQVRLWVCLREVTTHALVTRPHIDARLRELLVRVVHGMAEDTAGMMEQLQGIDLSDPEALPNVLDPEKLLARDPSPENKRAAAELMAVVAALLGYVEHVLDMAAARLLGGRGAIAEAWRRRQVDREANDRAAELMLGLDLSPAQVDRGADFVRGVLERAGEDGLAQLWSSARTLPTPAEVDAPGLWLERISLGDEPPAG